MDVWFVRSNCTPVHNDPLNRPEEYVPGEPHLKKKANYKTTCLRDGFSRIGWPNTGPLRPGFDSDRLAPNGYTFESIDPSYQNYLMQFASIVTGDLVLMPSGNQKNEVYKVHIGVVVLRNRTTREVTSTTPGLPAYYYFHDIPNQPYECAHRVDVAWGKNLDGSFGVCHIDGFNWRLAFCRVNDEVRDTAIEAARTMGLPIERHDPAIPKNSYPA